MLVEWALPVGVVLPGEGTEADGLQFIESGKAQLRRLGITAMAEGGEHVLVLLARKAVGIGDRRINRRADSLAGVFAI